MSRCRFACADLAAAAGLVECRLLRKPQQFLDLRTVATLGRSDWLNGRLLPVCTRRCGGLHGSTTEHEAARLGRGTPRRFGRAGSHEFD